MKFENMIAVLVLVFPEMCSFVNLHFENEMLALDLSGANVGRWRLEFTGDESELMQNNLGGEILNLGYRILLS